MFTWVVRSNVLWESPPCSCCDAVEALKVTDAIIHRLEKSGDIKNFDDGDIKWTKMFSTMRMLCSINRFCNSPTVGHLNM